MTVRDARKKTGARIPAERSLKGIRPTASRPRPLRDGSDSSRQLDEVVRTFSDRWEW